MHSVAAGCFREAHPQGPPSSGESVKGTDNGGLSVGLNKAIYNHMHGVGLERDVHRWGPAEDQDPRGAASN